MLDEGFMEEVRAETMQREKEDVCAALQYTVNQETGGVRSLAICSQFSLLRRTMEGL